MAEKQSYGIELAHALRDAELTVVKVERPRRSERRRGKSDPIDDHLAALQSHAWTRIGGRRLEPMGIVKPANSARRPKREMTITKTKQTNRLRALLLGGDDTGRDLARGAVTDEKLTHDLRRRGRIGDTVEQSVPREEVRRLRSGYRLQGGTPGPARWSWRSRSCLPARSRLGSSSASARRP